MTKDGGRRIATAGGAILADAAALGDLLESAGGDLFAPQFWAARAQVMAADEGRGATWFIDSGPNRWVLRHYRRGGLIARYSRDRYVWAGEARVRAFAEYRLLARLTTLGLPVPRPIAARYERLGITYRCDLITQRIPDVRPLSSLLRSGALGEGTWKAIGTTIARLHLAGVDHADLNAHNILADGRDAVSVIDFDRSRMRRGGRWRTRNLSRLHSSLEKVTGGLPPDRFSGHAWRCVLAGYESWGRSSVEPRPHG
jgi:3-deoxy-D-manno-octulosonic acid kinase